MNRVSTVERAFQLAKSGDYESVDAIRSRLDHEEYSQVILHLGGGLIRKQLRLAIKEAAAPEAMRQG